MRTSTHNQSQPQGNKYIASLKKFSNLRILDMTKKRSAFDERSMKKASKINQKCKDGKLKNSIKCSQI